MNVLAPPAMRDRSLHPAIPEGPPPHILMLVGRECARDRCVADRLRREAGATVEIVQANLDAAVDITLIDSRLQGDGRLCVLVDSTGATFMVSFPGRASATSQMHR